MHILIAPDSFKDCLTAPMVAQSIHNGIQRIIPNERCTLLPLSDGGEGFVETMLFAQKGERQTLKVQDALGRPIEATYAFLPKQRTAIIEMASASGIEHLTKKERNPLVTSTFGTGELIKDALDKGCTSILIGIGGSATNDGGTGMAKALGFKFLDELNQPIPEGGGHLNRLKYIDFSRADQRLQTVQVTVACDVNNPLTGPNGASAIYGPQKGADEKMIAELDQNLSHFAKIVHKDLHKNILSIPGGGAAGGLGAGLVAFANASLAKGFEVVAGQLRLEETVCSADLIITGEGKIDQQTNQGKTPWGVAQLAKKYHKPVVALGGILGEGYRNLYEEGFTAIFAIADGPSSPEDSIQNAADMLANTSEKIVRLFTYKN